MGEDEMLRRRRSALDVPRGENSHGCQAGVAEPTAGLLRAATGSPQAPTLNSLTPLSFGGGLSLLKSDAVNRADRSRDVTSLS